VRRTAETLTTKTLDFWTPPWLTWSGLNKHLKSSWKRSTKRTHTHTHTHTHTLPTHSLTHPYIYTFLCVSHTNTLEVTVTLAAQDTILSSSRIPPPPLLLKRHSPNPQCWNWIRHKVTENVNTRAEWEHQKRGLDHWKECQDDDDEEEENRKFVLLHFSNILCESYFVCTSSSLATKSTFLDSSDFYPIFNCSSLPDEHLQVDNFLLWLRHQFWILSGSNVSPVSLVLRKMQGCLAITHAPVPVTMQEHPWVHFPSFLLPSFSQRVSFFLFFYRLGFVGCSPWGSSDFYPTFKYDPLGSVRRFVGWRPNEP
jgi:hypothetical protein